MKKVFLEELPRRGQFIDWKLSVGYKIPFVYDDIKGELPILDIIITKKYNKEIITEYGSCKNFHIDVRDLTRGRLGVLLGKCTHITQYKFKIGDILESCTAGRIVILKQIRMPIQKHTEKGYKCHCLICGDICEKFEYNLKKNGCGVCAGTKVLKGYNDLWTTHPDIAKMLKYPEIGYTISHGSGIKQIFICPDCGCEKEMLSSDLINHEFSCPRCSDNISYPEKFVFNALEQLKIPFITQLSRTTFNWVDNFRYDFYVPSLNWIIEANGEQHYRYTGRGRTLKEEQINDELKEKLAKKNEIKEYIILDCSNSKIDFIENSMLNSNISNMFDLSNIDWLKCHRYACDSLVKKICNLFNIGNNSSIKIGEILKLDRHTIYHYLKQGKELGWCDYDAELEREKRQTLFGKERCRQIICVTTNEIFTSLAEAGIKYKIDSSSLAKCCKGIEKYAGIISNGVKLIWMYYEEYIIKNRTIG